MDLDASAATRELAKAVAGVGRFLPSRVVDPVRAGVIVTAGPSGITFAGTDRERSVRVFAQARVHHEGKLLVPAKALAETLRNIDVPETRLLLEGSRLVVRTPQARFALPVLDLDAHPGVGELPPSAGTFDASLLPKVSTVAAAASRDDALPVFTGVHCQQRSDQLVLAATDRFRMAVATLPWCGVGDSLDTLVPASLLAEVAKEASGEITVHAERDRVGFSWAGAQCWTSVLDASFPDESRHLSPAMDCTVDVEADELAGAVRRVTPYAGSRGVVGFDVDDAEIRVRAHDPQYGEADEAVKASVSGDRMGLRFQPRYLSDALRAFGSATVRIGLRSGKRRSSVITETDPDAHAGARLYYVLMPLQLPE